MAQPVIKLEGITRRYRSGPTDVLALRSVDLEIQKGEFVAVMGASGSGKSTLFNLIGCLDTPDGGHYYLDGQDVSKFSSNALADVRNQTFGFVFQSFHLLSRTSALENVELPMLYANVPPKVRHERARQALTRVGLESRMDHKPNQLSGGQQQRVAIARALVSGPKVILADEPTGNLDSAMSLEIIALLQEFWRTGITLLLITHELDIATFAPRLIVMKDGQVQSDRMQEPEVA